MKAIETRFIPATSIKPSRISATDNDGNRVIISYPSNVGDQEATHRVAALALCDKMNWSGRLVGGSLKHGYAFVFVD